MPETPSEQSSERIQDSDTPPSSEDAQEAIREQLLKAEVAVRQWLKTPAGHKTLEIAKVAAPVAASVGAVALAGVAVWWWKAKQAERRHWHAEVATMHPVLEADKPTLAYLRETLVGRTESQVESLIGEPIVVDEAADRWIYPLSTQVAESNPDQAAFAIDFNDEGRVEDVAFLVEPHD